MLATPPPIARRLADLDARRAQLDAPCVEAIADLWADVAGKIQPGDTIVYADIPEEARWLGMSEEVTARDGEVYACCVISRKWDQLEVEVTHRPVAAWMEVGR